MLRGSVDESGENKLKDLTLDSVITNGKEACSYGTMTMGDGSAYQFCDLFEFKIKGDDVKIVKIRAFMIEL